MGRRNSEGESEAEGVEPGTGVPSPNSRHDICLLGPRTGTTGAQPVLTGWLQPGGSTTHVLWSPQGQPAPLPQGGFGHWGRAELGTPVGTGRPCALTSENGSAFLPEDTKFDES